MWNDIFLFVFKENLVKAKNVKTTRVLRVRVCLVALDSRAITFISNFQLISFKVISITITFIFNFEIISFENNFNF